MAVDGARPLDKDSSCVEVCGLLALRVAIDFRSEFAEETPRSVAGAVA